MHIQLIWAHSAAYCCDSNSNTMLWAAASQCERERATKRAQVATHKRRTNDERTNESSTKTAPATAATAAAQQQRHQTGWQQSRRHEMLRRFSNGQPFARWTTKPTQTAKPKPTLTERTEWRSDVCQCESVCVRAYVRESCPCSCAHALVCVPRVTNFVGIFFRWFSCSFVFVLELV